MDADIIEILIEESKGIIFAIFISSECPHCTSVEQKMKEISNQHPDFKMHYIVNDKQLMKKYSVKFLPTVLTYKDGWLVDAIAGDQDIDRYLKRL